MATEQSTEEWRPMPIPGFGDSYSVSSMGRIRRDAECKASRAGRILRGSIGTDGYVLVHLSHGGAARFFLLHRLVALAFFGPPPHEGDEVDHIDGRKANNAIANLRFVSHRENINAAVATGLVTNRGEMHASAKLTDDWVRLIRELLRTTGRHEVARRFGVHYNTVRRIHLGLGWTHVK